MPSEEPTAAPTQFPSANQTLSVPRSDASDNRPSLSAGAIVGITVGTTIGIVFLILIIALYMDERRTGRNKLFDMFVFNLCV